MVALREEVRETLLMLDSKRRQRVAACTSNSSPRRSSAWQGRPSVSASALPLANRLIDRMVDCGVLRELTGHRRNRRFAYQRYIDLFAD